MYSFPDFEPVCSSMSASWPAYRFLRRQVRWSSIPISSRIFHSLLWFTQKLLCSQWKRSRFFWNSLAFSMIQRMLTVWSLVPLPLRNPACTSGSSWFMYCWKLTLMIWGITYYHVKWQQLHGSSLALCFFGTGMITDLQSCGHCWVSEFTSDLGDSSSSVCEVLQARIL